MNEDVKDLLDDLRNKQSDVETVANDIGDIISSLEEANSEQESFEDKIDDISVKAVDGKGYELDVTYQSYDDYEEVLTVETNLDDYFFDRFADYTINIEDENGNEFLTKEDRFSESSNDLFITIHSQTIEASEKEVERILNDTEAFIAKVKEVEEANFFNRIEALGLKDVKDLEGLNKRLKKLAAFETLLSND
jgi:uncharacterized protein YoxC